LIISDGILACIWVANVIVGNNGGKVHTTFILTFWISAIIALLKVLFEFLVMTSYGTQAEVFTSWFGGTSRATPASSSTWTSDLKYIMWKNVPDTSSGYDANYTRVIALCILSSILELTIFYYSAGPFTSYHTYMVD
jgi:hypothetical protein